MPGRGRMVYALSSMPETVRIVVATRNRNKLAELRRILAGSPVELEGLDAWPECPEVEETGDSFEENAILKASFAARFTGLTALADDSGLEVDALAGAPGVRSARYAGDAADDRANLSKLLHALEEVPAGKRSARFRAAIALASPDGKIIRTFQGKVDGTIGFGPKGETGFGYDPVFYPLGYDVTFAQMGPARKDAISHRADALRQLKAFLSSPDSRLLLKL